MNVKRRSKTSINKKKYENSPSSKNYEQTTSSPKKLNNITSSKYNTYAKEKENSINLLLESLNENSFMFDRMIWVLMNLVGQVVEVEVKSGEIFEGIFHTVNIEKGFSIVLKMARKKDLNQTEKVYTTRPMDTLIILPSDFVQLYAKDINLENNFKEKEFAIDSQIVGNSQSKERELQPWKPDEIDENKINMDLTLETKIGHWDQFAVNKKLFGVESTWDEKYYTTSIDPEIEKKKAKEAERIAREIESGINNLVPITPHLAEEKGLEVNFEELDEESRYGAVIRDKQIKTTNVSIKNISKNLSPTSISNITLPNNISSNNNSSNSTSKEEKNLNSVSPSNIQKNISLEEMPNIKSKESTISPKSPLSSAADVQMLANERLRVRLSLVNEKFKNSAPVTNQKNQNDFPEPPKRSPLLSPLIGDAKGINALSLEPSTPKFTDEVVKNFFDFSLNRKKQEQRIQSITEMKKFSENIEKKIESKSKEKNKDDTTSFKSIANSITTEKNSPIHTSKNIPTLSTTSTTSTISTTSTHPTTSITSTTSTTSTTPTTPTTPTSSSKSNSKLNPNAKIFKPMSANVPNFNPLSPIPISQPIPPGQEWYDPYYPNMKPMFNTFIIPPGPQVGIYPSPIRVPVTAPFYAPPTQPIGVFPQPVIYSPSPTSPQSLSTSSQPLPTSSTTGKRSSTGKAPVPPYSYPQPPIPRIYPPGYIYNPQPPVIPVSSGEGIKHPQPTTQENQNTTIRSNKINNNEQNNKFSGVPNTDNIPNTKSPTNKEK